MEFINTYKKLEKLCNDKYNASHGVSLYIEEMASHPKGDLYVKGYSEDLKKLKYYRHLRNRIVHDVDCDEKTLCKKEDEKWLNNFYNRLLKEKDPLSLYANATKTQRVLKPKTILTILLIVIIIAVLLYLFIL